MQDSLSISSIKVCEVFNEGNLFIFVPKISFKGYFYMKLYEFQFRVYTLLLLLKDYEILRNLNVELHV